MIPRYRSLEIERIWSEDTKFKYFLKVELKHLEVLEENKSIPPVLHLLTPTPININLNRIQEIEQETKHDFLAFLTSINEQLSPEISKYMHYGLTSNDVIDSAQMLMVKDSIDVILNSILKFEDVLQSQIAETKNLLCIGRTHGRFAEPMIFAQKWLSFLAELSRRKDDLIAFKQNDLRIQASGAVGSYSFLHPDLEDKLAQKLEIKREECSTQVIPRDRYAKLASIFSHIAILIERVATELRLLQHSDVDEVYENFSYGQKGSSVMPHKRNPISSENLCGIARVIKSYHQIALENCNLWHERDISHSSSERIYLQDMFGYTDYALTRLSNLIQKMTYQREKIEEKVWSNEECLSSMYLHQLLHHSNLSREESYKVVQEYFLNPVFNISWDSFLKMKNISIHTQIFTKVELKRHYVERFEGVLNRFQQTRRG